jgi:hypothetical protein
MLNVERRTLNVEVAFDGEKPGALKSNQASDLLASY